MKIIEFNQLISTLGWTLLHSLWQGILVWTLYKVIAPISGDVSSRLRYAISAGSLILILMLSVGTFGYILTNSMVGDTVVRVNVPTTIYSNNTTLASSDFFTLSGDWINNHLSMIIMFWIAGVLFFGIRLTTGWWSSIQWQRRATRIEGHWSDRLQNLATELGVKGGVVLMQCAEVSVPVVFGFLKPVIMLPVGMLTGLSAEQIEAILLHELAHIRRQDYLVNLIQSFAEVIFFFNPIVWLLSSQIRIDRELCCDDIVVRLKNPLAYATALHQLEADRSWTSLGVAATGHKNQLLQRIKRIMEGPVKREGESRKLYSVLIVVVILLGCSWISVQAKWPVNPEFDKSWTDKTDTTNTDTIPRYSTKDESRVKTFSYSRKSVTVLDENGVPHKEVIEHIDGDQELQNVIMPPPGPQFLDFIADAGAPQHIFFTPDTIPDWVFSPGEERERERINKEFSEKFKKQFGDFYQKNGPEFERMLSELEKNIEGLNKRMDDQISAMDEQRAAARGQEEEFRELAMRRSHDNADRSADQSYQEEIREKIRADHDLVMADQNREIADRNRELMDQDRELAEQNLQEMDRYEQALAVELVHDGYLKKGEKIETLNIQNDGMNVNGKKVKSKDVIRYQELRRHYSKESKSGWHIE